jgi:glyoxylase-like metal-dependent hydrolase (beta-lactamase superfamily II)
MQVGNWGGGELWKIKGGYIESNCFFCKDDISGIGVLIDSGLDGVEIDSQLMEFGLVPNHIFCTHGHFDHVGGAFYLQKKYGCNVFLHEKDRKIFRSSNFLMMAMNIDFKINLANVTYVSDDFSFEFGRQILRYILTPGHTPGSSVIEVGSAWFTGDTLYSKGVGLSSLPGADDKILKQSILKIWGGLTEDRLVCPGHGEIADGLTIRNSNNALLGFMGLK